MFLSSVLFLAFASTFSSAMFVSGTRNFASSFIWYEKLVQVFWYQFSVQVSGACVIGISSSRLVLLDEVVLCQAWLPRWVTILVLVNHLADEPATQVYSAWSSLHV